MFVHIYRVGEADDAGLHQSAPRVTHFADGYRHGHDGKPVLVLGTLPNLTVIPLETIRWFWVEED